jgi:hypothetical protein
MSRESRPFLSRADALGTLVGLAVVLAGGAGLAQDKITGNSYSNAKYGIEITKPSSWHFITAATIVDLAKKAGGAVKLRGDEDPVKLAGFAVVVSKEPALGRGVQPQVILRIQELPAAPPDMVKACEALQTGMTEPETLKPTRPVQVSGRPAARLDFQGIVDGDVVRAAVLCTFKDKQAFVVVGQALASEFDSEFSSFESILASFRLR